MFDPRLMLAFEEKYGEGSFLRFLGRIVALSIIGTALVIAAGVNGLI